MHKVNVEISARHVHLCENDLITLFGDKYELGILRSVSQPGQFAAKETVRLQGPRDCFENVRIVGPAREQTQVEITTSDARRLGVEAPIRVSGDLSGTKGGLTLIGPQGRVDLVKGVIVAKRHLHIEPDLALSWKLSDGDLISISLDGPRSLIFNEVIVRSRVGQDKLTFQVDTDEANAAGILGGEEGVVL